MEQERVNTMDKEEAKRILDKAAIRARDTNVPSSFDADNHVGRNGAPTGRSGISARLAGKPGGKIGDGVVPVHQKAHRVFAGKLGDSTCTWKHGGTECRFAGQNALAQGGGAGWRCKKPGSGHEGSWR